MIATEVVRPGWRADVQRADVGEEVQQQHDVDAVQLWRLVQGGGPAGNGGSGNRVRETGRAVPFKAEGADVCPEILARGVEKRL